MYISTVAVAMAVMKMMLAMVVWAPAALAVCLVGIKGMIAACSSMHSGKKNILCTNILK